MSAVTRYATHHPCFGTQRALLLSFLGQSLGGRGVPSADILDFSPVNRPSIPGKLHVVVTSGDTKVCLTCGSEPAESPDPAPSPAGS